MDMRYVEKLQGPYASNADEKLRAKLDEVIDRLNVLIRKELNRTQEE